MYRKFVVATIAALLVVGMVAGMAFAAVTFDADTGEGYVGKGDVQTAYGWNNKQLQDNAEGLTFTYEASGEYTLVCSRTHPQQGYQEQTFKDRVFSITGSVDYDPKKQNQISGFNLSGYVGEPEFNGQDCPEGWPNEVSREPNGEPTGGLYAQHPTSGNRLLWQ
jgi:hypothetical protein